jgi:hypothetical protein
VGKPEKQASEPKFSRGSIPIFTSPTTAPRVAENAKQDIYGRGNPFREFVHVLGLVGCGDLFSKDVEDGLGRVAGLKPGKERMRGQVILSLTIVSFRSSVENGGEVGMRGGC